MWIFDNLLYKVVALLVACVLWSTAQGFRSVERSLDVPIRIQNLPPDLVLVDQSVSEVNVRIVGSRAAVRSAAKNLLRYPISLEGAQPGERTFPVIIEPASLPRGARVLARSPSTVRLEIERIESKRVTVRVDLAGEPPVGYRIVSLQVEPAEVLVEGARRSVRRLREVVTAPVDVSRLRATIVQEVALLFGEAYVWRGGEGVRGKPVSVEIRIERIPDPEERS